MNVPVYRSSLARTDRQTEEGHSILLRERRPSGHGLSPLRRLKRDGVSFRGRTISGMVLRMAYAEVQTAHGRVLEHASRQVHLHKRLASDPIGTRIVQAVEVGVVRGVERRSGLRRG